MDKTFFVYILSSRSRSLYVGVTSNIIVRVAQHKEKVFEGHTARYNIDRLVYWEEFSNASDAIAREKQVKGYSRAKKDALINGMNPAWVDLSLVAEPSVKSKADSSVA
jgi:putative endonuclease